MFREFERLVESAANNLSEEDLTNAADKLREKQFIYKDGHGQNTVYNTIVSQSEYFEKLFGAFGDDFFIDQHFGYCGILPKSTRPKLKQMETIFLLLLAKMHDLECRKARSEKGKTKPSEALLLDEYVNLTGREKPKQTETRRALERLSKVGVVLIGKRNELTEMEEITILPAITRVVTTGYLDMLDAFSSTEIEDIDSEGQKLVQDETVQQQQQEEVSETVSAELYQGAHSVFEDDNGESEA